MNLQTYLAFGARLEATVARFNNYTKDEAAYFPKKVAAVKARHAKELSTEELADVDHFLASV